MAMIKDEAISISKELISRYLEETKPEIDKFYANTLRWNAHDLILVDQLLKFWFINKFFTIYIPADLKDSDIPPDPKIQDDLFNLFYNCLEIHSSFATLQDIAWILFKSSHLIFNTKSALSFSLTWKCRTITKGEFVRRILALHSEKIFSGVFHDYLDFKGSSEIKKIDNLLRVAGGYLESWFARRGLRSRYEKQIQGLKTGSIEKYQFRKEDFYDMKTDALETIEDVFDDLKKKGNVFVPPNVFSETGLNFWDSRISLKFKNELTERIKKYEPILEGCMEEAPLKIIDRYRTLERRENKTERREIPILDQVREEKQFLQNKMEFELQRLLPIKPWERTEVLAMLAYKAERIAQKKFRKSRKQLSRAFYLVRREGYSQNEACKKAGISVRTFQDFYKMVKDSIG
jgi:hypothetical protein